MTDNGNVCIPHYDVVVADLHDTSSLQTVITHVRSSWNSSEIKWMTFRGTSNLLIACYIVDEHSKENGNDIVLIRLYGKNSEYFVDHDLERKYMMLLWKHNLSSEVFCTFQNGYCHGYINGRVLSLSDLSDENMSRKCASLMARLHSVPLQHDPSDCLLFRKTKSYIKTLDSSRGKHDRSQDGLPSLTDITKEVDFLENLIETKFNAEDLVLCHNDISSANLVFNQQKDTLHLIDFEFCFPNYPSFDVANFFAEFAGVDGSSYDLYPDDTFQKWWIKFYLDERKRLRGVQSHTSPDEVNNFFEQTGHFTLMSHLFWVSWAVLQANVSELDYDYVGYASRRMSEYYRRKKILGL